MFNSILHHWMLWTGISSVTIALIAAAIFIPAAGPIISAFLTPIASAIGNWVGLWLSDLATGLRLMLSTVAGIVFMLSVAGGSALAAHWYWPSDNVKTALADLHQNYECHARKAHKKYVFHFYDPVTWW